MNSDIKLKKIGDPDFNSLPRGIIAIILADKVVFVRRLMGRFIPVSKEEQLRLEEKHIIK